jgi:Galactose binding lectin domain
MAASVTTNWRCTQFFFIFTGIVNSPVDEIGEYCQMETMKGRCRWKSEVIVMTSARWGRMKTGRCLNIHPNFLATFSQDPMFLGCSEDVISIVDMKCSGRSECDIRIPDADLEKVTPCYPDQKSYLETSYTCVKG